MNTGFDPAVHGFAFRNRFAGSQVLAELARQGRVDEIVGVDISGPMTGALTLAGRAEFWDGFGLCGGMAWTALDEYVAGREPDHAPVQPDAGSSMFATLVRRQADSFHGTELVHRIIDWIKLPTSSPWWGFWLDGMGRRVLRTEWPNLRTALEQGRPEVLCLIRTHRPDRIAENHQVVAIGATETEGSVSISLYDPNHPGATPTIDFNTGDFLNRIDLRQSTGEPIVGFFVWAHRPLTA